MSILLFLSEQHREMMMEWDLLLKDLVSVSTWDLLLKDLVSVSTWDLLLKDLVFASTVVRGTYAQKNTRKQNIYFLVTRKRNSVSETPKLFFPRHQNFLFQRHQNFPFPRRQNFPFPRPQNRIPFPPHSKQNSVSTPALETEVCFHSTRNEIPLHLNRNSVSTPLKMEFCFQITLLYKPQQLVVWCSVPATATSSQVQSLSIISNGFSQQGCLDLYLDSQILLRRLLTSSSKISFWFQKLTAHASKNLGKMLLVQNVMKLYDTNQD